MRTKSVQLAIGLVVLAAGVIAQQSVVVGPARQANPPGTTWWECSVAARQNRAGEVVVCAKRETPPVAHAYAVTLDGGVTFVTQETILPLKFDGSAAVDPATDRIWMAALTGTGTIAVTYKEPFSDPNDPNGLTFQTPWEAVDTAFDKPLLTIGQPPGGGSPSRHYLTYGLHNRKIWAAYSDLPTSGVPWTPRRVYPNADPNGPSGENYRSWGTMGTVLPSGRILVVSRDDYYPVPMNNKLPVVVYSQDADSSIWWPEFAPPVRVAQDSGIEATTIGIAENLPGDTPFAIDRRNCARSIARDPASNDVYVAFYARRAPGSTNTDIYISRLFRRIRGLNLGEPAPQVPPGPFLGLLSPHG